MEMEGERLAAGESVWEFEYSVECQATPQSVWLYWTDISNWNDPPAEIELEGPFAAGSLLTTRIPGQEPLCSVIKDAIPEHQATIDMHLPGAVLSFHWRFEPKSYGQNTRLTQRLTLGGERADEFLEQVKMFEQTVPQGMSRLASAIEFAVRSLPGSAGGPPA